MYEPLFCLAQTTYLFEVSSALSVMSPSAPARMTKIGASGRRPRCDLRAAAEPPQFLARFRVVAANEIRPVGDQLDAVLAGIDRRRAPRGQFFARRLPDRLPCFDVNRGNE